MSENKVRDAQLLEERKMIASTWVDMPVDQVIEEQLGKSVGRSKFMVESYTESYEGEESIRFYIQVLRLSKHTGIGIRRNYEIDPSYQGAYVEIYKDGGVRAFAGINATNQYDMGVNGQNVNVSNKWKGISILLFIILIFCGVWIHKLNYYKEIGKEANQYKKNYEAAAEDIAFYQSALKKAGKYVTTNGELKDKNN